MENGFQVFQSLALPFLQLSYGNLGPAGDDIGDLFLVDHLLPGVFILLPFLTNFIDLLFLLFLFLLNGARLLIRFVPDSGFLLILQLLDLFLQLLDLGRLHKRGQAYLGSCLIDYVDGLIWHEPVVDIPGGKLHRGRKRRIGDRHMVVRLIAAS